MSANPGSPEEPGYPAEEEEPHPAGHLVGVGLAVVVVEDEDGGDHAARHHEHDHVEVGPYQGRVVGHRQHVPHDGAEQHDRQQQVYPCTTFIRAVNGTSLNLTVKRRGSYFVLGQLGILLSI